MPVEDNEVVKEGAVVARIDDRDFRTALDQAQADVEAAAVATAAWLGLVRAQVTAIAVDDERLVQATMALAAVLVESGRPQLPPSLYSRP